MSEQDFVGQLRYPLATLFKPDPRMSSTERSSPLAEYAEAFGFIFVAVVVAWLLAKDQVPFNFVPMALKAAVLSIFPFVIAKIFGPMAGRIVMAIVVVGYLQHELHFLQ